MPTINIQIIQESKVLFGWKVIPVQTNITVEQFFLEVAEEHILNCHLDLIEKIEARCGQSKTTVNQNIDLACNLWEVALDYGKHFVFRLLTLQTTLPSSQYTNPFEVMFNTQNSITLPI